MNIEAIRGIRRYHWAVPRAANLVLVVLIGVALARLVWLGVPPPEVGGSTGPAIAAGPEPAPGTDPMALIATITDANLFGSGNTAAPPAAPVEAPETHLDLTLTGILASSARRYAVAIIADAQGKEKFYRAGDDVVADASLNAIYINRVILERNGRFETLRLTGAEATDVTAANDAGDDAPDLSDLRQTLLQDPARITEFVRLQPVYADGDLSGYRVYPGSRQAVFFEAGLRPGDLITAINGVSLQDPSQGLEAINALSQAATVNVTLERLGQTQNLSIDIR